MIAQSLTMRSLFALLLLSLVTLIVARPQIVQFTHDRNDQGYLKSYTFNMDVVTHSMPATDWLLQDNSYLYLYVPGAGLRRSWWLLHEARVRSSQTSLRF